MVPSNKSAPFDADGPPGKGLEQLVQLLLIIEVLHVGKDRNDSPRTFLEGRLVSFP